MPSFNVQNAKALSISEGDVKTIHDSNGQLLWGAVGYSTKYEGDTEQQTYTGKNLFDPNAATNNKILAWTSGNYVDNTGSVVTDYISVAGNTKIQLTYLVAVFFYDSSKNLIGHFDNSQQIVTATGGGYFNNFTVPSGYSIDYIRLVLRASQGTNPSDLVGVNTMVNTGDTLLPYEPYVGGIPSPNPDYPQPISVVTGTQTVTLSDGTNTEDFTVSLGSEELCKIGEYQDYIYKDGSDWKVHKVIEKLLLDGTEGHNISSFHNQLNSINGFRITLGTGKENVGAYQLLSDHFRYDEWSNYNSSSTRQYATISDVNSATNTIYMTQASDTIGAGNSSTSVASMNTWFASNNVIIYYALTTPTDTQITDTTLIGQLNAIEAWLTRYGYSATVSGILPLVITQTELA